jgi:hypothetical protein
MIEQKLDSIHHNPVQGKWRLVVTLPAIHIQVRDFMNWVTLVI